MTETNNGGPAFPSITEGEIAKWAGMTKIGPIAHPGMSLRDYFAGQALAGWLASFPPDCGVKAKQCAELAYELADAMIAAGKGGDA
ncbi:MAG: hypothetical protein D1H97_15440 [Paracoccus sp. BP8]|nr:MAG: hypothetical protein D1H97_15440 [Paracoccus sp. BP8]